MLTVFIFVIKCLAIQCHYCHLSGMLIPFIPVELFNILLSVVTFSDGDFYWPLPLQRQRTKGRRGTENRQQNAGTREIIGEEDSGPIRVRQQVHVYLACSRKAGDRRPDAWTYPTTRAGWAEPPSPLNRAPSSLKQTTQLGPASVKTLFWPLDLDPRS